MKLSAHEVAWATTTQPWNKENRIIAIAVAFAESGGETDAIGRSSTGSSVGNNDHGLWQISGRWNGQLLKDVANRGQSWRDPHVNAWLAFKVWKTQGWEAWSTFTSGSYEKYLPDAKIAIEMPFRPIPYPVDYSINGEAPPTTTNA